MNMIFMIFLSVFLTGTFSLCTAEPEKYGVGTNAQFHEPVSLQLHSLRNGVLTNPEKVFRTASEYGLIEAEHSAHLKNLKERIVGNLSGGTDVDHDAVLSSWQADYPAIPKTTRGIGVPHFDIEDESAFLKHRLKITVRTWNRSLGKILYRKNHDIPEADFCGRVLVLTQTSSGQNQKGIG